MPRGRAPAPGPGAANRTDLVNPPAQPVSAVPGQGYGVAADQQEAQRIAPMSGGGTAPPAGPGGPQSSPPSGGPPGPNELQAMSDAYNGPGTSLALNRPTERPNEPVTAGLPVGPGPGPESLTGVGAAARENVIEQGTLNNLLQSMSSQPNATSAVKALAAVASSGAQ